MQYCAGQQLIARCRRSSLPLQGWLRMKSSNSTDNSGIISSTRKSGRSNTLSGRPPPVEEADEEDPGALWRRMSLPAADKSEGK